MQTKHQVSRLFLKVRSGPKDLHPSPVIDPHPPHLLNFEPVNFILGFLETCAQGVAVHIGVGSLHQ